MIRVVLIFLVWLIWGHGWLSLWVAILLTACLVLTIEVRE